MSNKTLKPCPFCGEKATLAVINLDDIALPYYIYCTHMDNEDIFIGLSKSQVKRALRKGRIKAMFFNLIWKLKCIGRKEWTYSNGEF